MKRAVRIGATCLIGPTELVVGVAQEDVGRWALEFALLLGGFCSQTDVTLEDGSVLSLVIDQRPQADRTQVARLRESLFRCELSRTQAGYVHSTLLRAFRDEMAEVSHIHVEGTLGQEAFDLTLAFDTYRPPMTAKEAEEAILRGGR